MALPSTETYGFVKDDIAKRLGYGGFAKINSRTAALIETYSQSAFKQLYKSAEWITQRTVKTIPLIDDVRIYDFPDETSLYHLMEVWVTENSTGRIHELKGGIRVNERDERIIGPKSRPEIWYIESGNVNLEPAPDAERWDTLNFRFTKEVALIDDNTEVVVDDELLILYSMMFIYGHRGDDKRESKMEKRIDAYEPLVRAGQDEDDGFQIGGHQSSTVRDAMQKRNRISDARGNGRYGRRGWRSF